MHSRAHQSKVLGKVKAFYFGTKKIGVRTPNRSCSWNDRTRDPPRRSPRRVPLQKLGAKHLLARPISSGGLVIDHHHAGAGVPTVHRCTGPSSESTRAGRGVYFRDECEKLGKPAPHSALNHAPGYVVWDRQVTYEYSLTSPTLPFVRAGGSGRPHCVCKYLKRAVRVRSGRPDQSINHLLTW